MKKCGIFGARADGTGLAAQTQEYFTFLKPDKTLLLDLTELNRVKGKDTVFNPEPFPDAIIARDFPNRRMVDSFLDGIDVCLCAETPYTYYLFEAARTRGIKTVLHYNYEFLDYLAHPDWPKPDVLLACSTWHIDEVKEKASDWGCEVIYLPVPVNRRRLPFRIRSAANTFLHIAGHKTYLDRNGTDIVLSAIPFIKSKDIRITIRSQHPLPQVIDSRVTIIEDDSLNYWDNYKGEDVLLLPRRYGGQSLQLNEALSCGMVPIMTNCSPQDEFLKPESLIDPDHATTATTRSQFDVWHISPESLANRIDFLHMLGVANSEAIENLSIHSNNVARTISWDSLLKQFKAVLES